MLLSPQVDILLIVNIDEEEKVCKGKKKGWAIKSVSTFLEMIDARG